MSQTSGMGRSHGVISLSWFFPNMCVGGGRYAKCFVPLKTLGSFELCSDT